MAHERAVYQFDVEPLYGFLDYPEWGVDIHREDCAFVFDLTKETGYHACVRSACYDDMTGYIDVLQREGDLPAGKYVVCYYVYDNGDLLQLAEVGVTREEIIENVLDQKYVEGADYFLIEEE